MTRIYDINGVDVTEEIREKFRGFIRNFFGNLSNLTLDDLTPNPYLMKIIGEVAELNTAQQVVSHLLSARIERSTSTGFGNTFQKIATVFTEGTGVAGADISMVRENQYGRPIRWYIQMKSGPSTVNKDICLQISQELQSAVRRDPGSAGLLGITYGRPERVSGITQQYLAFDYEAGREFWEFISGDPDCYIKLYRIAVDIASNYTDRSGMTLNELIEFKRFVLTEQFIERFGEAGEEMWQNFLEGNM